MAESSFDWQTVLNNTFQIPSLNRGASGASPLMGSSNTSGAIELAGGWQDRINQLNQLGNTPGFKSLPQSVQDTIYTRELTPPDPLTAAIARRLDYESSDEAEQKKLDRYAKYAKEQGDQMMKYRMTNDIIANLGSAARSAFGGYSDPNALARMAEGVATSYNNALQASAPLTQLGQGIPSRNYYRV